MSPSRIPSLTLKLLLFAFLAGIAGAVYALFFNPEMAFWKAAAERKLAWVEEMRREHGRVIGVIGGSTTTFAIDADMLHREHGLPVANLGLHAGMGPDVCAGFGFAALKQGDTLIVSLEPALLGDTAGQTPLGAQFAYALGRPEIINWDGTSAPIERLGNVFRLQPGGYHVVTMLGKLALGKPPYRYRIEDARPGGLQTTAERRPFAAPMDTYAKPGRLTLSNAGRTLLERVHHEADKRGIHAAYVMPWAYSPELSAAAQREVNRELLREIAEIMPVLPEEKIGVSSKISDFADSGQHLTWEAAKARSAAFAATLQAQGSLGKRP